MRLLALPLLILLAAASQAQAPEPLPAWVGPQGGAGIQLDGSAVYNSVAIAEIDGLPGVDIAVATASGVLSVVRADGTVVWSADLPNKNCGGAGGANKVLSSPAVGALFGDGVNYVVIGYGGLGSKACGGGVVAYDGRDGSVKWHLDLRKFSNSEKFWSFSYSVFSTPALADVEGDGTLEIGFGSWDRNVYLLNADGSVRWYYNAADTVWSSATFANVDADPALEMIIGTDISGNSRLNPPTSNGGYLYAFNTVIQNRTPLRRPSRRQRNRRQRSVRPAARAVTTAAAKPVRFQFRDPRAFVWKTTFDQVVYAAPVIADWIADRPGPEIAVASGCFFPQGSNRKKGAWVKILNPKNGKVLRTLNLAACSSAQPAPGDLNGDGVNDLVITASGATEIGGSGTSTISAFTPTSGNLLWSAALRGNDYAGHFASPITADLNGDGQLEVVVANGSQLCILAGQTGETVRCLDLQGAIQATPAVADVLGNGTLSLVVAARRLYGWHRFDRVIPLSAGTLAPFEAPWPMHRGNAIRTGRQ